MCERTDRQTHPSQYLKQSIHGTNNLRGAVTLCTAAAPAGVVEPFRLRYGLPATVGIAALAAALSVATSGGNLLVIAAFRIDAHLQRVSNYFLLSLAVADFAIGAVSMPLFTVYLLLGRWPLGKSLADAPNTPVIKVKGARG